jgi:hypothetical protein
MHSESNDPRYRTGIPAACRMGRVHSGAEWRLPVGGAGGSVLETIR